MTAPSVPVVAHDRVPVTVTRPDRTTLRQARMILTVPDGVEPARLMVWTRPGTPTVDEPVDLTASTINDPRNEWTFTTPTGVYRVLPGRGACCSPMRHWQPFDPMVMGALP